MLTVTLHINRKEISAIVSTFERYDYDVIYYFGNEQFENEIHSNYTVSYTHLDVYKRQALFARQIMHWQRNCDSMCQRSTKKCIPSDMAVFLSQQPAHQFRKRISDWLFQMATHIYLSLIHI